MNGINVAIYTLQHFNPNGLIERQYSQYPQCLYHHIYVETPI
jgi:predicted transcriptional regulator